MKSYEIIDHTYDVVVEAAWCRIARRLRDGE